MGLTFTPFPKEGYTLSATDISRLERKITDVSQEMIRVSGLLDANTAVIEAATKAFDRAQDRAEKADDRLLKVEERITAVEVQFSKIAERYGKIMTGTAGGGVLALIANAVAYYLSMRGL
jgi:chromosome segregation ATPase